MSTIPVSPSISAAEAMYRDSLSSRGSLTLGPDYADLARRISSSTTVPQRPPMHEITNEHTRKMWLAMRLRLVEGQQWPFDFLETHLSGERVLVFTAIGDKHVVLEDASELFPSDALVTQLRLIAK